MKYERDYKNGRKQDRDGRKYDRRPAREQKTEKVLSSSKSPIQPR